MTTWTNLDRIAASCSQAIVNEAKTITETKNDLENVITKALGVLQENGVYAMTLFLLSRSEKERRVTRNVVLKHLIELLFRSDIRHVLKAQASKPNLAEQESVLPFVADEICDELDRLLLVKSLYEQVLIYSRYGAKAIVKDDKKEEE
ncbi:hypothetical protein CSA56_16860 [candidate division KSB3 bacterium]|uniref:CRISPR type III-B/RAMP module-associated protein Cmr5 n=1 Tax=candidate division KSB3 bacterium TaxID=2044937 RepID=A0A2G6KAY9_9BACT|nr:MAG: hypothetical protein CSA56_16860 [candidate division KSB3 bacterium]